jgi:hypothetical protein
MLGHRTIKSTEVYISIVQAMFETSGDDCHVKVAHGLKEACQLVETGFEHITEMDDIRSLENASDSPAKNLAC